MRSPLGNLLGGLLLIASSSCERDRRGEPPPTPSVRLPDLARVSPSDGSRDVPRTAWMVLDFVKPVDRARAATIQLQCGIGGILAEVSILGDGSRVVVNPSNDLPSGSSCEMAWYGADGSLVAIHFDTAAAGPPANVLYDRDDRTHVEPLPDDALLVADPTTLSGSRLAVSPPDEARTPLFSSAISQSQGLDGWSPIAPMVVELDSAPDPTTLPLTAEDSLDPLATVALIDVDPNSPARGLRVPFTLRVDDRPNTSGTPSHMLVILPARPLEALRRYALVVTRRALVDPTRPLGPSAFMGAVLEGTAGAGSNRARVLDLLKDVVAVLGRDPSPPLHPDDIALLVRITTRSLNDVPNDMRSIRSHTLSAPPPQFSIDQVAADSDPNIAALVHGTFQSPLFIDQDNRLVHGANGQPKSVGVDEVPFVIALPKAALLSPVPTIMLQHGHPSDAPYIVAQESRTELAPVGLAGIGFTDIQNRRPELANLEYVLDGILKDGHIPDYEIQTWADQLAFIRMLPTLEASLDVLPLGPDGQSMPDGVLDIDGSAPLVYGGFSAGSFHGVGLLAYAPEIRGAALVVGGGNWAAKTMLQNNDGVFTQLTGLYPTLTRADVASIFTLAQMGFDRQDPLIHARFASNGSALPSIFMTEGIGDTLVPVEATRAAAWELGLPQLGRVAVHVPFLDSLATKARDNLGATAAGAFVQFVPLGIDGIAPTPACAATGETVAHYCADASTAVGDARVRFFQSVLGSNDPVIAVPDN